LEEEKQAYGSSQGNKSGKTPATSREPSEQEDEEKKTGKKGVKSGTSQPLDERAVSKKLKHIKRMGRGEKGLKPGPIQPRKRTGNKRGKQIHEKSSSLEEIHLKNFPK